VADCTHAQLDSLVTRQKQPNVPPDPQLKPPPLSHLVHTVPLPHTPLLSDCPLGHAHVVPEQIPPVGQGTHTPPQQVCPAEQQRLPQTVLP